MKSIFTLLLLPIFFIPSKSERPRLSINKINGIYLVKKNTYNQSDIIFAICKNEKNKQIKVGFRYITDKGIDISGNLNNFISIEKWQPYNEEMILSKDSYKSYSDVDIKYDDGAVFINYIKIEGNKISGATFLYGDDYDSSFIGEKVKPEFEIIDLKSKKIIEICESR